MAGTNRLIRSGYYSKSYSKRSRDEILRSVEGYKLKDGKRNIDIEKDLIIFSINDNKIIE